MQLGHRVALTPRVLRFPPECDVALGAKVGQLRQWWRWWWWQGGGDCRAVVVMAGSSTGAGGCQLGMLAAPHVRTHTEQPPLQQYECNTPAKCGGTNSSTNLGVPGQHVDQVEWACRRVAVGGHAAAASSPDRARARQ